jgi:glycosyltransferase involved in cell wall biosynthesis
MRLGLIARADHRGLGQQTRAMFDHLQPARTMVVNCPSANPLPLHLEYFPGAMVVNRIPTDRDCHDFLSSGIDVVYSAETFYNANLPDIARQYGVKTVLHVNPEFLDIQDRPTLWAAPSVWRYDELPEPKIHLPVPITPFPERPARHKAGRFLHVIGRPAIHDRNGSRQLLEALRYVRSPINLTITCQDPGYVPSLMSGIHIPDHVELEVRSGDVRDNRDLFAGQDVLVLPRRFGGLCLPAQEAIGAGMPVIMPAISPNDSWLPGEWLVPATRVGRFMAKVRVDLYTTDVRQLAERIDRFATDCEFYATATDRARAIAKELSWDNQLSVYEQMFADLAAKKEATR